MLLWSYYTKNLRIRTSSFSSLAKIVISCYEGNDIIDCWLPETEINLGLVFKYTVFIQIKPYYHNPNSIVRSCDT